MDPHLLIYLVAGLAMLGMTFIPCLLQRRPLSLPTLYVTAGALFFILPHGIARPDPLANSSILYTIERASELIVILSIAGAGVRLDRSVGWKRWMVGWRLLAFAMPITIFVIATTGSYILGLAPASAILLGAVLAPTDPVLAEDVQVEKPDEEVEDEVRFGLTLEASLNDGLAFPFVYLAIMVLEHGSPGVWLWEWFGLKVLVKIAIGLVIGILAGNTLTRTVAQWENQGERESNEGVFVIAGILLTYAISEIAYGYGFIAVFVAAYCGSRVDRSDSRRHEVHEFIGQAERLSLAVLLLGFGGLLVSGISEWFSWKVWLTAGSFVWCIRPLLGFVSLIGMKASLHDRLAISFFGIRGLGSVYYLAFAAGAASFPQTGTLWAVVCATIVCSVVTHGVSVSPVMRYVDRQRGRALPETITNREAS